MNGIVLSSYDLRVSPIKTPKQGCAGRSADWEEMALDSLAVRPARVKTYACGVKAVWTEEDSAERAAISVADALKGSEIGQLLVFFSPSLGAAALSRALSCNFAGTPVAGCTTAGQISPGGFSETDLLAVAFPKKGFRIASGVLPSVRCLTLERGAAIVRELRAQLDHSAKGLGFHKFALCLIDGLSNSGEMIVSALGWALNDIPLTGGSAGDNLLFRETALLHNGETYHDAALLLIVETEYAVRTFRHDNFEPTDKKLVVTASDSESRTVFELNAESAANEYAMAACVHGALTSTSFAGHPVVVRIGGDYYCRSIKEVNPDGSLTFWCAIDDGVVLTVARARDFIASAEKELTRLDNDIGGLDFVLGFECVFRRLDAETQQIKHRVEELYKRHNIVGFHTYGEQFNSMHLNQTLTGVVIGPKDTSYVHSS
jgi:hypothetical protein